MKKIFILTIIGLLSINSYSQNKFGYIDSQELLLLMPERKTAEEEVQTFAKSLESQLQAMTAEYQQSVQDYQANEASYSDLVKQDKVTEITGLEQRIQAFQQNANEALMAKEKEIKVIDVRHQDSFAKGHIPNSIFIGLDGGFAPWVGAVLSDINQALMLVVDEDRVDEAITRLSRVGFDNVKGYLKGGFS